MFMGQEEFKKISIKSICDVDFLDIQEKDIYMVWFCKTLQNAKGLFSTDTRKGWYWECTYNGDKEELYIDTYMKSSNDVIKVK